jgi:3-oxoisoapionate kinase
MDRTMHLIDFFALEKLGFQTLHDIIGEGGFQEKAPLVLFDTLEDRHLPMIGRWISQNSRPQHQLLLGSSAIEYALGHVFGQPKKLEIEAGAVSPTLIVAGSCSQTTADQLHYVESLGYAMIRMKVSDLLDEQQRKAELKRIAKESIKHLSGGRNTVIYSALGPGDPVVQTTLASKKLANQPHAIALAQATVTRAIIDDFPLKRLVTAGGDTSGYIIKELGITALEFKNVLAPGAPLCIAHSDRPTIDGLDIAIKGGQNGTVKYFEYAQKGGSS